MRSLLIIIGDFGQAVRHATRSGGDQQAGGRRDARRLHRSAICAGAGGGRTRCAPTATLGAHVMRRSTEARGALREIMPQIMTRRAQESRKTYILLRLHADRLRDYSPQWCGKGCFLLCVCTRTRGEQILKPDFKKGHPLPRIDHLRAGLYAIFICLPALRLCPHRGKTESRIRNESKTSEKNSETEQCFRIFLYPRER